MSRFVRLGALIVGLSALDVVEAQSTRAAVQSSPTSASPKPLVDSTPKITPAPIAAVGSPAWIEAQKDFELLRHGKAKVHWMGSPPPYPMIRPTPAPSTPTDRGTTIVPHRTAKGESLKLQKEIAAAIGRLDLRPKERTAHFDWIWKHPLLQSKSVAHIGWHGGIVDLRRSGADGPWRATVHMYPWLYSPSLRTFQRDHVVEVYEYADGKVRLVDSDAAKAKPELQKFPDEGR